MIIAAAVVPLLRLPAAVRQSATPIENTNAALLLVLVLVVVAASLGSRAAGLTAALVSAAGFDIFLTEPYGQLRIHSVADIQTTALLLLIGVAVTELALWGRRQQARASEQRGYLDAILQTTSSLAGAAPVATVIEHVEGRLVDLLGLDRATYVPFVDRTVPALEPDGSLSWHGGSLDTERSGWPTDTEVVLRVGSVEEDRGAFQLVASTHVSRPTLQQRQVAVLMAEHVAATLRQEANH